MKRVAVFVNGRSFYDGVKNKIPGNIVDFKKLSRWIMKSADGEMLTGCGYYTGIGTDQTESYTRLNGFLNMIELQLGYFVNKVESHRGNSCPNCGEHINDDRDVSMKIAADMLTAAALNAYDIAVVVSVGDDMAPVIDSLRSLGKQVYIAGWSQTNTSVHLRKSAFGFIDLTSGVHEFSLRKDGEPAEKQTYANDSDTFLDELEKAQDTFEGGYVGLSFFLKRWNSETLNPSSDVRQEILDRLIADNLVEMYEAEDGSKAIRVVYVDDDESEDDDKSEDNE